MGLAKVAVQCSASTFVGKIATFAKPKNVSVMPADRKNDNVYFNRQHFDYLCFDKKINETKNLQRHLSCWRLL
jgi:hypothetical protein